MRYSQTTSFILLILCGCSFNKPDTHFLDGKKIDFYGLDKNDFLDEIAFNKTIEGQALFKSNEPKKAKAILQEALELELNNVYILQALSIVETHSGEPETALKRLRKILKINPDFVDCYLNMSMCFLILNEYDSVNKYCDLIIEDAHSDNDLLASAYFNKSVAKLQTNNIREALDYSNKALLLCHNDIDCNYNKRYKEYIEKLIKKEELKELFNQ